MFRHGRGSWFRGVVVAAVAAGLLVCGVPVGASGWAGVSSAAENLGGLTGTGFTDPDGTALTGSGQMVVVIDGGFNPTHPMLKGRVKEEVCFSEFKEPYSFADTTCTETAGKWELDGNIRFESGAGTSKYNVACVGADGRVCNDVHGTAVAALAAGSKVTPTSSIGTISGIAPGADLALLKVGTNGDWSKNGVYAALRYVADVLAAKYPIAAVNVSMSFDTIKVEDTAPCPVDEFEAYAADLKAKGTAVVVAAGNRSYPAATGKWSCADSAIAVGSTNVTDPNTLTVGAAGTNASNRIEFLAPVGLPASGSDANGVWTAWSYRTSTSGTAYENNYNKPGGTSFAAPQVAGAYAVLKQRFPTKTVDELTLLLRHGGVNVADTRAGNAGIVTPRIWLANSAADRDTRPVWDYTNDRRTDLPILAATTAKPLMLYSVRDDGKVDTTTSVTVASNWTGHTITVPAWDYDKPASNGFIASVTNGTSSDLNYYHYNPTTKTLDAGTTIATDLGGDLVGGAYVQNLPTVGTGTGVILQRTNGQLELRLRTDRSTQLSPPVPVLPAEASTNSELVGVADINTDHQPDLIVRDATTGVPRAHLGTTSPTAPFTATATVLSSTTWWADKTQVAMVDQWALTGGNAAPWAAYRVPPNAYGVANQIGFRLNPDGTLNSAGAVIEASWPTGARNLFAARND